MSGHLIDHAPCPCLVIPYKPAGLSAESSLSEGEEGVSPRDRYGLSWTGVSQYLGMAGG